jgi:hypothetical protein
MYHPFDPAVTLAMFRRLELNLREKPRRIVVCYLVYSAARAEVEAGFGQIDWLRPTRREESITGDYDWLFYSN